ncbi:MAG: BMP family protein [Firmicutes bacterium]|nr:BMP family protein [Bacillota bacterium]
MMRRFGLVLLALALVAGLLAGCGGGSKPAGGTKMKIALVLPGSINDAGWNAAAYKGLMKMKDNGTADVAFSEKVAQADIETALRDYAAKGYQLVFGHGFEFGDPVKKVAPDFPKTYFICINGGVNGANFASMRFANWETDYILGVLAAKMTKSNKLGAVGAHQISSIVRPIEAFKAGAKSVNPNIKVSATYIGSWEDVNKAKEAALALIDSGCDFIHVNADAAAHGAYEACKSRNVLCIGNTNDQNHLAPTVMITSSLRNVDRMFELAVDMVKNNKFEGKVFLYGLKDNAVGWASFHDLDSKVSKEVKDLMEKTKKDIIDGKIQVPVLDKPTPE